MREVIVSVDRAGRALRRWPEIDARGNIQDGQSDSQLSVIFGKSARQ
jgi:hypothetical protein